MKGSQEGGGVIGAEHAIMALPLLQLGWPLWPAEETISITLRWVIQVYCSQ